MNTLIGDIAALMSGKALAVLIVALVLCFSWLGDARAEAASSPSPRSWSNLLQRLQDDGLYTKTLAQGIQGLPPPSPDPMGRKIKELYTARFARPHPLPDAPKRKPAYFYPNVVTPENAAACRAFFNSHRPAFEQMKKAYGVPGDIAVALLFVETRLGASLGKNRVFYTLASMAESRLPEHLGAWLHEIDQPQDRMEWLRETMLRRSNWAYRELAAFIRYAEKNGIDPFAVPGSIYGAFGICQFMPSSVEPYAADGNGDGLIDLFTLEDALTSLASYLVKNGWKSGISHTGRHAVLRRYNRADIYANTILALADMVRGEPVGRPIVTARRPAPPSSGTRAF
ncbi:MAG: lytic murein transglycosylase [Desulfovibrio sp.]|jgi:membrane-bound lytic murein transglycosylase B|nr:lytic murein transglycosylase [Desulfovibrio sp.]